MRKTRRGRGSRKAWFPRSGKEGRAGSRFPRDTGEDEGGRPTMKALIITHVYTPSIDPRAFRWTAISEHWVSQGHSVDVLSGWRTGLAREETRHGVRVCRVGGGITENIRGFLAKGGDRPGRAEGA